MALSKSGDSELQGALSASALFNAQQVSQISTHFSHVNAGATPSTGATMLGQLLAAEVSTSACLLLARCLHMGGPAVCTGEGLCAAAGGGTASSSSVFSTREGLSAAT